MHVDPNVGNFQTKQFKQTLVKVPAYDFRHAFEVRMPENTYTVYNLQMPHTKNVQNYCVELRFEQYGHAQMNINKTIINIY